jgi:hypothetical protein
MANTRRRADTIQIGNSVKFASMTHYVVIEDITRYGGEYPCIVFLLSDGSMHRAFPGAWIWWREAAFAD